MENETNDVFEIKLNETGITYIRRAYKLIGLIIFSACIISLIALIIEVYRVYRYIQLSPRDRLGYIMLKILPFFYIVTNIVALTCNWYYYKFGKLLNRSVVNHDENMFNYAFRYLYRNVAVFVLLQVIIMIVNMVVLFDELMRHPL